MSSLQFYNFCISLLGVRFMEVWMCMGTENAFFHWTYRFFMISMSTFVSGECSVHLIGVRVALVVVSHFGDIQDDVVVRCLVERMVLNYVSSFAVSQHSSLKINTKYIFKFQTNSFLLKVYGILELVFNFYCTDILNLKYFFIRKFRQIFFSFWFFAI